VRTCACLQGRSDGQFEVPYPAPRIVQAWEEAPTSVATGIRVDPTGSSGLAGLLEMRLADPLFDWEVLT
jgi:hypothetical protein